MGKYEKRIQKAREIAATAWCGEKTSSKPMDADLAEEFARIIMRNKTKNERTKNGGNMKVENYFNTAVEEINEELKNDGKEEVVLERGMFKNDETMLTIILRTRRDMFQGWINRMKYENDKMNVHDITERDIIENIKYVILDDCLAMQAHRTKQIGW